MSAVGEVENATVEKTTEVVAVLEQSQPVEKPVKEKKAKAPKEKKPKTAKTASHPPYFQMIKEALLVLNEKGGSSPYAIGKYLEQNHKAVLPANFRKILGLQLKNSAARGKLIKIKASYKLSEAGKTEKGITKPAVKKTKQAKSTTAPKAKATKTTETVKKVAKPVKKVGRKRTKKSTPAKPKQLKSIKSPAAKKAKRAMA
ncbi:hypothetical protein F0562_003672 [Nyssa sinensis]|uniref:H15 domain-containing protein n=1 Tax=Nyssa sinensis TaxID=561372 RepID=A0A5J5BXU6_9ASTE|nr:hypothetical protein F0562_003672 [Nyssa sinensis]